MRLSGFQAIEFADRAGLTLNKFEDAIDSAAVGLTVPEAEAIADDRPELIWLDVADEDYYGMPRNMEPGSDVAPRARLAGQRVEELLPGQNSGDDSASGARPQDEETVAATLVQRDREDEDETPGNETRQP